MKARAGRVTRPGEIADAVLLLVRRRSRSGYTLRRNATGVRSNSAATVMWDLSWPGPGARILTSPGAQLTRERLPEPQRQFIQPRHHMVGLLAEFLERAAGPVDPADGITEMPGPGGIPRV